MNLRLSEPLVEAVKQKLIDNMEARVAAVNADPQLPDFASPLVAPQNYYTSGLESIPAGPAIIVAEGPTEFAEEGSHSLLTRTQIGVFVLEQDPDRQMLGKRLQRQTRAVIESLYDSDPKEQLLLPGGGQAAYRIAPLRTEPGRVFQPDAKDTWRSFYATTFAVSAIEEG